MPPPTQSEVPAGQLDLTDGASSVDPTVTTSYEELLFAHNEQTLNMGVLQDLLVPAPGPPDPVTGVPTTIMVPVSLAPPMTAGSASGSVVKFLRMFDGTYHDPGLDHTGFLTTAELRLIAEWLDIGAQYYNDPFVAPVRIELMRRTARATAGAAGVQCRSGPREGTTA